MANPAKPTLDDVYREYIQVILNHEIDKIDQFVSEDVVHNGKQLGLKGYKELLLRNIIETNVDIHIERLVADSSHVAAVLTFTTKPSTKSLVGIELDGLPFSYRENVLYDFRDGKVAEVHSLFDIDTIRSHSQRL